MIIFFPILKFMKIKTPKHHHGYIFLLLEKKLTLKWMDHFLFVLFMMMK